jgi:hypothetical protein
MFFDKLQLKVASPYFNGFFTGPGMVGGRPSGRPFFCQNQVKSTCVLSVFYGRFLRFKAQVVSISAIQGSDKTALLRGDGLCMLGDRHRETSSVKTQLHKAQIELQPFIHAGFSIRQN